MSERKKKGTSKVSQARRFLELILAHLGNDPLDVSIFLLAEVFARRDSNKEQQLKQICSNEISGDVSSLPGIVRKEIDSILVDNLFQADERGAEFLHILFEVVSSEHSKSDKGQYFTPTDVGAMCASVITLKDGMTVCDVACGSGIFLENTWDILKNSNMTCKLFGYDISERSIKVAKSIAVIYEIENITYEVTDSLKLIKNLEQSISKADGIKSQKFDVIITNPPFAGDVGDNYASYNFSFCDSAGYKEKDVLFLELCIELLNEDGQLIIVLPDNKFSSKSFSKLRTYIHHKVNVEAVISLHPNTFRPFTQQKASVLIARKSSEIKTLGTLFVKSESSGKLSNGQPSLEKTDYLEISDLLKAKLQ